jgi:hypothetical protein
MFNWIKNFVYTWRATRRRKKLIKEMRKRDPFIY